MCRLGSWGPTVLNKKPASAVLAGWFWMDWSFVVFYGIVGNRVQVASEFDWIPSPYSNGFRFGG